MFDWVPIGLSTSWYFFYEYKNQEGKQVTATDPSIVKLNNFYGFHYLSKTTAC